MKPEMTSNNPNTTYFMNFLQLIPLRYQLYLTPTQTLGHCVYLTYGGKTPNATLPLTTLQWINVNLQVQFLSYIQLSVWQGSNNYNTAPDNSVIYSNPSAFVSNSLNVLATSNEFYVDLSEIRVFSLDPANSWGQYFKFYQGIWPSPSSFISQVQYYTAYGNTLYMDINNATKTFANPSPVTFNVDRCLYGQSIGSMATPQPTDGSIPQQINMTSQQCNYCLQPNCLICPTNYNAACKVCSNVKNSSCVADLTCPAGYYLNNGICSHCPPGCTTCTSATLCTGCQGALRLLKTQTTATCSCASTQYGVADYTSFQLNCFNCDFTKCQSCVGNSVTCTACSPQLHLFLYGSTCVANCVGQLIPSYTSISDNTCQPCGQYCNSCINSTFCNSKQCLYQTGVVGGVVSYNHNGLCLQVCPSNSLSNTVTQTCDDCLGNCAVCTPNITTCIICNAGFYLYNAMCVTACPNGMYPDTTNVCQKCPSQCVICQAAAQCSVCVNSLTNVSLMFYYVNYQCVLTCPARYYGDNTDPTNLFCRSCPSGCTDCTNEYTCTICDLNQYLDSFYGGTRFLCVSQCQAGHYPNNSTMACQSCLAGCNDCDNATSCFHCSLGLVLYKPLVGPPQCLVQCPAGMYADSTNTCQNCISGCQQCSNNYTCDSCNIGYFQLADTLSCVMTTCPVGYFVSGSQCALCRQQCATCSSALTCDSCIVDYQYKANQCLLLCGNGARESNETCDDGNNIAGDGCSPTCSTEDGYECMPLDPTTSGPDVCFCNSMLQSASWTDYWGAIVIKFNTVIVYNTANGPKSSNAGVFCSQILDPSILPLLGTTYSCFLSASATSTSITINVDLDSTIGNNVMNFKTTILFNNGALSVKGCPVSIPLTYTVTNLPLDSPIVYFQSALNGFNIPMCAPYFGLNIFTSKGFTQRNVQVQWTLIAMSPVNDDLKSTLQTYLDTNYIDVKFFEFTPDLVESLAGTSLTIKVAVTNFLGIIGTNTTTIQFLNSKQLIILDLLDIYTLQTNIPNTLAPRVRIPYCAADNSAVQASALKDVTIQCTLFSQDLTLQTPLSNCTINAFNMTLGNPYMVQVKAINLNDPNMGVIKWVHIDTAAPNAEIAYIQGCNQLFSVNAAFNLKALISTNVTYATFTWYCTDQSTGSPCFTTSYSYVTMANTQLVTIQGGQFFPNNTYLFTVIVYDSLSQTTATQQCNMYAALQNDQVLNILIDTESNKNGYIDFNAQMAAFKVQLNQMTGINSKALNFTWKFSDSSGTVFPPSKLSIYQNSLGVLISNLERSNVYQIECNLTYGIQKGYIKTTYQTQPPLSLELSVQPLTGEPLNTIFTFSVTSQDALDGLYSYVFGYVDPTDGISNIPIYQKTPNRYQRTQLPVPGTQGYLTCYVQVILPSGESKTYLQNVTLTYPTITVATYQAQLQSAVMDNLLESTQMMNILASLSPKMTTAQISFAVEQVLAGLQQEKTPLSDYNIQSSVASLLEYISQQTATIKSDALAVTVAANLFNQLTIGENKMISQGQYLPFGLAATTSLYNFANNIFKQDLTNVIGGPQQLQMKNSFMQGLGNILRGSLANQILGDVGGFSYQGQNIYVKAVKFDQLESNYKINASLPSNLTGKLAQNFVNISLPSSSSVSNPCQNMPACQVSVIIMQSPVNAFISNAKDSVLMSMFVDMSISSTEVSSPNTYIQLSNLAVQNLVDPITLTIPLSTTFTDANLNHTLGCGYLDQASNVFKEDGLSTVIINNKLVTCMASHLTAIAVEDYMIDQQSLANAAASSSSSVATTSNSTSSAQQNGQALQVVNLWGSWAVYVTFSLLGILGLGIGWGYQRDKRDELNLRRILLNKEKIYVNLFLDPLPDEELANEDEDDDYHAIQEEKERMAEVKRIRLEEKLRKNRAGAADVNAPVKGLFSPEELVDRFGIDEEGRAAVKAPPKQKKKKKKVEQQSDVFFEGGDFLPEYVEVPQQKKYYEGGEGEDGNEDVEMDEGAVSVKPKGKKKKKKRSSTLKSSQANEPTTPKSINDTTVMQQSDGMVLEDVDQKSITKLSRKSTGKKKRRKSLKSKASLVEESKDDPPEEIIQFNDVNFGGFKFGAAAAVEPSEVEVPAVEEETKSKRSKKGSKRKRGSRSSSAHRQRTLEDEEGKVEEDQLKPDVEAEEYSPQKKRNQEGLTQTINREDLFKPIREIEQERLGEQEMLNQDLTYNANNNDYGNISPDAIQQQQPEKKKKLKKKKTLRKKKTKKDDDEEEDDDEDGEEGDDPEMEGVKQKKRKDVHDEPAGCCHLCCWNFREGHRCLSHFSFYNGMMSRPMRWAILVMSWYLFMVFSGLFMGGKQIIGDKGTRLEQLICGLLAAFTMRFWIIGTTYFVQLPTEAKVRETIPNKIKANRIIRTNKTKFYVGLAIIVITIIFCAAEALRLSSIYNVGLVANWGWSYMFSILMDFVVVEGLFMAVVTLITLIVGSAPDVGAPRRGFWLSLIPQAIKESLE